MEKSRIGHVKQENINLKKDRGEILFADIKKGMRKFSWSLTIQNKKMLNKMIENVGSFRKADREKYEELLSGTDGFPDTWKKTNVEYFERNADKGFAKRVDKLFILNNLVELEKFDAPTRLREIIKTNLRARNMMPDEMEIESLLKDGLEREDYRVIERGLKIFGWSGVVDMVKNKDIRYKAVVDDRAFSRIEESIGKIEKGYDRKLKFKDARTNLLVLYLPEYAEKILLLKGQINELEQYYKIDRIEHIDEFEKIDAIKETELKEILSGKFKAKMDLIKEVYDLEKFGSVDILRNWKDLPEEEFEKVSSRNFAKRVEDLGQKIGRSKAEIIQFFVGEKFKNIEHPTVEALLEGKVIFSDDVREAKPDIFEILGNFPRVYTQEPSLWGRIRQGEVSNAIDLATFGRPEEERDPYIGWGTLAVARNITKDDLKKQINSSNLLDLAEGYEEELSLEKAKERFDYVRENLLTSFKPRFNKIFEFMGEWRNTGKKIEEKNSGISLNTGAYVEVDIDQKTIESSKKSTIQERDMYIEIYQLLDESFKSPSWMSLMIGEGVEMLYELISKRKHDFVKQANNLEYLNSHRKFLAPQEIRILEKKSADILNAFGIMENVYKMPKGVYLSNPPLHAGMRGEEPSVWIPRSAAFRDRTFQESEYDGKVTYVNTKEYYLSKQVNPLDQLKIQLISFSDKPDPKNLANEGFSVKLERNGQTKFLNKKEMEEFTKALKEYTLPTLFLENSPLLEVSENREVSEDKSQGNCVFQKLEI